MYPFGIDDMLGPFNTFEFPHGLHAIQQTSVGGARFNGPKIVAQSIHDQAFRASVPHFYTLSMFPAFEDVDVVRRVLDTSLPLLKHLCLDVELLDPADKDCPDPPVITLLARNLPALQTLIAHHCFVRLDTALVRNLRRLHLKHDRDMEEIERLPISHFLDVLRNCVRLEELFVGNYLDVQRPSNAGPSPVVSLEHHNHLKLVTLEDEPHIISRILSSLHIPTRVQVIAISYVSQDAVPALEAMLPDNWNKLPILREATTIRVDASEAHCHCAVSLEKNEIPFDMELRVDHPDFQRRCESGAVFAGMVRYAERFRGAPARTLRFAGNVLAVPEHVWATAIDAFPDVREISVEDIPNMSYGSLSAFLPTLLKRSAAAPGRVICPSLSRFVFRGGFHEDERLPELICRCFAQRAQSGARPLEKLHLQLFPDRVWRASEVARFRQALACVAGTVVLEVNEPVTSAEHPERHAPFIVLP
ncbi:hypothetical protein OH77DRAFT_1518525 [Trametes cingulata]|nr:hypothetical protein OH77DRAFT_1518525 [Trametes cingulata]